LVILLLIGLGLPFREDLNRSVAPTAPRTRLPAADNSGWRAAALTAGIIVVIAAVSPVLAMQLDRVRPPEAASIPALDFGPDCTALPTDTQAPPGMPGTLVTRRFACNGLVLDVRLDVFAARSTAAPVLTAARRLAAVPNPTHEEEVAAETEWLRLPAGGARTWRLTRTTLPGWMGAVSIWVGGEPVTGGLMTRARLAWRSLMGGRVAPVVVAVIPELDQMTITEDSEPAMERRLASLLARADIGGQIRRVAAVHD
jgi:hypothetical protein